MAPDVDIGVDGITKAGADQKKPDGEVHDAPAPGVLISSAMSKKVVAPFQPPGALPGDDTLQMRGAPAVESSSTYEAMLVREKGKRLFAGLSDAFSKALGVEASTINGLKMAPCVFIAGRTVVIEVPRGKWGFVKQLAGNVMPGAWQSNARVAELPVRLDWASQFYVDTLRRYDPMFWEPNSAARAAEDAINAAHDSGRITDPLTWSGLQQLVDSALESQRRSNEHQVARGLEPYWSNSELLKHCCSDTLIDGGPRGLALAPEPFTVLVKFSDLLPIAAASSFARKWHVGQQGIEWIDDGSHRDADSTPLQEFFELMQYGIGREYDYCTHCKTRCRDTYSGSNNPPRWAREHLGDAEFRCRQFVTSQTKRLRLHRQQQRRESKQLNADSGEDNAPPVLTVDESARHTDIALNGEHYPIGHVVAHDAPLDASPSRAAALGAALDEQEPESTPVPQPSRSFKRKRGRRGGKKHKRSHRSTRAGDSTPRAANRQHQRRPPAARSAAADSQSARSRRAASTQNQLSQNPQLTNRDRADRQRQRNARAHTRRGATDTQPTSQLDSDTVTPPSGESAGTQAQAADSLAGGEPGSLDWRSYLDTVNYLRARGRDYEVWLFLSTSARLSGRAGFNLPDTYLPQGNPGSQWAGLGGYGAGTGVYYQDTFFPNCPGPQWAGMNGYGGVMHPAHAASYCY